LTDKGVDSVKNMNFFSAPEEYPQTPPVMPAFAAWESAQPIVPYGTYTWTETDEQSEPSSCNSGESDPDISDLYSVPYKVAGEQLYLAYRHHKRRWRKFTGGFKRRHGRKGKGRRFGKGKFGKSPGGKLGSGKGKKGKGKSFYADPTSDAYLADQYDSNPYYEQTYWAEGTGWSESEWDQTDTEGLVYLGKGKFKRGNPVGKDGKKLECSLCGSTEHFIAKCPQNKQGITHAQAQGQGKSFPTVQSSKSSAAASSDSEGWSSWGSDWGSRIYFAAKQEPTVQKAIQSYSVIEMFDGTEVVLNDSDELHSIQEETDESAFQPLTSTAQLRNYYLPPEDKPKKPSPFSRSDDSSSNSSAATRHFAFMWFMPAAFHAQVRIAEGGPALLVDPGAYDNLVGEEWVTEATQEAVKAGHGCAWQKLKNKLSVEGVGKDVNEATEEVTLPVCLEDGDVGTFTSPVIPRSKLPALLGLQSLTRRRALLDVFNRRIVFVGPGGYRLQLSPGSKTYKLYPAKTGHLMLPCQCWKDAKIAPGKPGTVL